jgi:hypothetical protein
MQELPIYARAPIKGEGMIANPDEFEFACHCKKCQDKYSNWKKQYEEQQNKMRGSK